MPLFLITYDGGSAAAAPAGFEQALRDAGARQALARGWVLRADSSVMAVQRRFEQHLGPGARLLVVEFDSWSSSNAMADINDI